jgi:hypothetical protein
VAGAHHSGTAFCLGRYHFESLYRAERRRDLAEECGCIATICVFDGSAGAKKQMNQHKPSRQIRNMNPQRFEKNPVVKLGPDIRAKIGMQLHLIYGKVVDQGVPDRFVQLLRGFDDPELRG